MDNGTIKETKRCWRTRESDEGVVRQIDASLGKQTTRCIVELEATTGRLSLHALSGTAHLAGVAQWQGRIERGGCGAEVGPGLLTHEALGGEVQGTARVDERCQHQQPACHCWRHDAFEAASGDTKDCCLWRNKNVPLGVCPLFWFKIKLLQIGFSLLLLSSTFPLCFFDPSKLIYLAVFLIYSTFFETPLWIILLSYNLRGALRIPWLSISCDVTAHTGACQALWLMRQTTYKYMAILVFSFKFLFLPAFSSPS